jgi:hypothetical protein
MRYESSSTLLSKEIKAKDKAIADNTIRPGINRKLVRMDSQRLRILVFICHNQPSSLLFDFEKVLRAKPAK